MTLPAHRNWSSPVLGDLACTGLFRPQAAMAEVIERCRGVLTYVATPYLKIARDEEGDWDPAESLECGIRAALAARDLAVAGVIPISPVTLVVDMIHADFLNELIDPLDPVFWEAYRRPILAACDCMVIPPIEGWQQSDAIWGDALEAWGRNMPVYLISPEAAHAA